MITFDKPFPASYYDIHHALTYAPVVETGEWHGQKVSGQPFATHELQDVTIALAVPGFNWRELQRVTECNADWAEEHFQERVGRKPVNPPASHVRWPYGNTTTHIEADHFSHSYPERFWPKYADALGYGGGYNTGIRFEYGDLDDIVNLFCRNILTRQAYLPVWFPEDLTAAKQGERVPCSLGYHFMVRNGLMTVRYSMRSCEYTRHLRDDLYMAGRLLQWVCGQVNEELIEEPIYPVHVVAHITSLHLLVGDL